MKHYITLVLVVILFQNSPQAQVICGTTANTTCSYASNPNGNGPSIFTPNSTLVFTLLFAPLQECEIYTANTRVTGFTGVTVLACPTSAYNCHGYAWHKSYGGNPQNVWIESNQIAKYWQDQSFYEVPSEPTNAKAVVTYKNAAGDITHSAVAVANSNPRMYQSKWGPGLLVEHSLTNLPPGYGTPYKYYLRCGACDQAPNLFQMTYKVGITVYPATNSVIFVPAGGYTLLTNLNPCQLNNDMTWTGNGNNWAATGIKKVSVLFNINAGQSVTFTGTAPSNCGTPSRTLTFVAQSGYRMASTT